MAGERIFGFREAVRDNALPPGRAAETAHVAGVGDAVWPGKVDVPPPPRDETGEEDCGCYRLQRGNIGCRGFMRALPTGERPIYEYAWLQRADRKSTPKAYNLIFTWGRITLVGERLDEFAMLLKDHKVVR